MKTAARILLFSLFLSLIGLTLWRLPVNGWGSLVWLGATGLMMVLRAPHARRVAANDITKTYAVSLERILLTLVTLGATLLPLLHLSTGLFSFASYTLPIWAPALSTLTLVPGFWLFWRSHKDLGRNWSVTTELREDHSLTTTGVYAHIRHPMYSAIWLIFAAYPLLLHNWIAGPAALIAFGIMYFVRVPIEEAMMRDRFGAEYESYCARTGRLWPRLIR